jgi:hypothetical protein
LTGATGTVNLRTLFGQDGLEPSLHGEQQGKSSAAELVRAQQTSLDPLKGRGWGGCEASDAQVWSERVWIVVSRQGPAAGIVAVDLSERVHSALRAGVAHFRRGACLPRQTKHAPGQVAHGLVRARLPTHGRGFDKQYPGPLEQLRNAVQSAAIPSGTIVNAIRQE